MSASANMLDFRILACGVLLILMAEATVFCWPAAYLCTKKREISPAFALASFFFRFLTAFCFLVFRMKHEIQISLRVRNKMSQNSLTQSVICLLILTI